MESDARRAELRAFLRAMRARRSARDAGLPDDPRRRRAQRLRLEEVAALADVRVAWYRELESGKTVRVSNKFLRSVAKALALSDEETTTAADDALTRQDLRPLARATA